MHLGDKYGRREPSGAVVLLIRINTPALTRVLCRSEPGHASTSDLQQARTILLVALLAKLLDNAGYTVECANSSPVESVSDLATLHRLPFQ